MNIKNQLIIVVLFCLLAGCSDSNNSYLLPEAPDYAKESAWYKELNAAADKQTVDVFYIAPTCVWDWTNERGEVIHFEDIYNKDQREALLPSLKLAAEIFSDSYNFYSPYYRQITLESWMEGKDVVEERFPYAMGDVKKAFDYYLANYNHGNPFIIAGFSQGGKAVVELLKDMPEEVYQRMVAAYAIGYCVTDDEISRFKTIVAAKDSIDTGVTICYNSVATTDAICPVLSPSDICIHPVNWKTDGSPAYLNDTVTVKVDTKKHVLLVEGFDTKQYYVPSLDRLFKEGNYHLQELLFYRNELNKNVKQRVKRFLNSQSKEY